MKIVVFLLSVSLFAVCCWCIHDTARERQEIAALRAEVASLLSMKPEMDSIAESYHKEMQRRWLEEHK